MKPLTQVLIYTLLTLTVALNQRENDESGPYEFGFTIEGEQHRHEKKDQNGIVQGEFGFITGDGVYHVTVYATDESGNFKILSMRNIRISAPLDGSPALGPISPEAGKYLGKQKQISNVPAAIAAPQPSPQQLPQQPHQQPPQLPGQPAQQLPQQPPQGPQPPQTITQKPGPYEFTTQPTIKPACSGCGYVTTRKPEQFQFQNPVFQKPVNEISTPPSSGGVQGAQNLQGGYQGVAQTPNIIQSLQQPGTVASSANIGVNQGGSVSPPTKAQNVQYQNLPNQELTLQIDQRNNVPPVLSTNNAQNQQQNVEYQQNLPSQQQIFPQNIQSGGEGTVQPPGNELLPPGVNNQYPGGVSQVEGQFGYQGGNQQSTLQANFSPTGINGQTQATNSVTQQQQQYYQGVQNTASTLNQLSGGSAGVQSSSSSLTTGAGSGPNNFVQANKEVSKLPPVSVSDKTIHVGGNRPIDIPIRDKYPGMVDGLPNGIEEDDIKDLLYKFHYTVGFHGHYEKGLKNGAKIGGYFVNGRDGISRVVTYIADENGYRPKFKFVNLGLDSPDTPKEDSEKKFGLKSFEFVWYPIE